ncbi:hypothetical protein AKJ45_02325 [candidate division MSBL1 archaeon SCGC-AAA261F19]|uniref:Translation initiation factor 2 subunit alpha n=1 Tax=candidate division MSBL1 archaeon SCGC-AAA261F19 TaxID=1698275 RepID=A0A133V9S1_9EURY|nr:hypothetical protein AKJ45_02325 [candidate division MSBL1 archaeon SCGC-AAA261F19]
MVRRKSEWPDKDEIVMCTAKKVFDQGAYVKLDEYGGKEGMIHISEVSSGWVKNIRRHIREGQKVICKVLNVDTKKGHIDLSMRRVKDSQRSWKSRQWKRDKKSEKLLEQVAKRVGSDLDTAYEKIGFYLQQKHDDIYSAFEEMAMKGKEAIDLPEVEEEWINTLMELIESSVEAPYVAVKGYVDLRCSASNGVEVIKLALSEARDSVTDSEVDVNVRYIGSPSYLIKISAPSYKVAERVLQETAKKAISTVEEAGGTGKFYTEREE